MDTKKTTADKTMNCGNCFFHMNGECHRRAPVPVKMDPFSWVPHVNVYYGFPKVSADNWCGEWGPKDDG